MTHSPLRILHVVPAIDPRTGGPAVAIAGLAAAQNRRGADISILATWIDGESNESARSLTERHITVELIGPCAMPMRRNSQIIPVLRRSIANCDIVHIHALWEESQHQAAKIALALGKPYLITPHGMLDPWSLAQSQWKKRLYLAVRMRRDLNLAAAVHFTSQAERDGAARLRLNAPSIVRPLGVNLDEFRELPPRGQWRSRHPLLADKAVIMYLGRIFPGKGLELLIPALATCGIDRAVLVIIGPDQGGYQATIEAMIAQHRLQERVLFTGILRGPERIEALVDADLFALPSFHENFGLAVVEALACGVPVVISDEVNIHREISAAGVGAVVPTAVEPLAKTLRTWLTDEELRRRAAAVARSFVSRTYDLDQIAEEWIEDYRRIIETRSAVTMK